MKQRLYHTLRWLIGLFMGCGLTYYGIRFGVLPMIKQWHVAMQSVLGALVFLFFTSVTIFSTLLAVLIVVFSLRELFRWKLKQDQQRVTVAEFIAHKIYARIIFESQMVNDAVP